MIFRMILAVLKCQKEIPLIQVKKKGMFSLRKGTFCDKKLDERKKERSVDKTRQK